MSKKKQEVATIPPVVTQVPAVREPRILHGGKVFEWITSDLFNAYVPVAPAIPSGKPVLLWKGSDIPWNVYCQLTSFMYWSYEETRGEAQARLAYNTLTDEWSVFVMPQERSTGLSTKELETHPDRNIAQAILRVPGVVTAGTAHHHCAISAFQSGIDKADEDRQDGLHITFGKLDEKALDVHARVTMRGHTYPTSLERWIIFPEIPGVVPECMHDALRKYWLAHPDKVVFPVEWKSRLIRPPAVTIARSSGTSGTTGYVSGSWYGHEDIIAVEDIARIKSEDSYVVEVAQRIVDEGGTITESRNRVDTIKGLIFPLWRLAVSAQADSSNAVG